MVAVACFLPGRAKDLSASPRIASAVASQDTFGSSQQHHVSILRDNKEVSWIVMFMLLEVSVLYPLFSSSVWPMSTNSECFALTKTIALSSLPKFLEQNVCKVGGNVGNYVGLGSTVSKGKDAERADVWDLCHWLQDKMLNYKNKAHILITVCVLHCFLFTVMSVAVLYAIATVMSVAVLYAIATVMSVAVLYAIATAMSVAVLYAIATVTSVAVLYAIATVMLVAVLYAIATVMSVTVLYDIATVMSVAVLYAIATVMSVAVLYSIVTVMSVAVLYAIATVILVIVLYAIATAMSVAVLYAIATVMSVVVLYAIATVMSLAVLYAIATVMSVAVQYATPNTFPKHTLSG